MKKTIIITGLVLLFFLLSCQQIEKEQINVDFKKIKETVSINLMKSCQNADECVPVDCGCSCSGCGGFSYQDVVNKEYVNEWYSQRDCKPQEVCPMVCCQKRSVVCENNYCAVKEISKPAQETVMSVKVIEEDKITKTNVLYKEVPLICGDGFCLKEENCVFECKKGSLRFQDYLLIIDDNPLFEDYQTAQEIMNDFSKKLRFETRVLSQIRRSTVIRSKLLVYLHNKKALIAVHDTAPAEYVVLMNEILKKLKNKNYTATQKIYTEITRTDLKKELE